MAARLTLTILTALLASPPAAALSDPTAPPRVAAGGPADGAPAEAGLAWVRVDGRNSVAWYGGTTVRLGESVAGGRVSAIREDHIVITGKGGRRVVRLLEPAVRMHAPPR